MTDLSLRDVIRQEHDVRRAREEVAYHEEQARLAAANPREQKKARHRAFASRRRLVRALGRRLLAPGPETEDFLDRLDGFLGEARLDTRILDDLIGPLTPPPGGASDGRS